MHFTTLATALLAVGAATALPGKAKANASKLVVDNLYRFSKYRFWDFSTVSSLPDGLHISDYTVDSGTYGFDPSNVFFKDGFLQMKVPGGQSGTIMGGEVTTLEKISWASVRTVAVLTETPGVCNGMFFYQSDNQETDIEWLSDASASSNADRATENRQASGNRYLWLSNQATSKKTVKTLNAIAPPSNPTSTTHEYRLDLVPGRTRFFIDGVQVWNSTKNVPSVAGNWVFNNWADGTRDWSAGPPAKDAIFKIKSIEMYYTN